MMIPPLFKHQEQDVAFLKERPHALVLNDPGTGKTRTLIEHLKNNDLFPALILAPKSILEAAWGEDINQFAPEIEYSVAYAKNREEALKRHADIYLTNHDAVTSLPRTKFKTLVVDESTAYKNPNAQRTKAIHKLNIPYRYILTGTFTTNTVMDAWAQTFIVDRGERLGKSFYRFRNAVCEPIHNGQFIQWRDKDIANDLLYHQIKDIALRRKLEECLDIPPNRVRHLYIDLPSKLQRFYNEFVEEKLLELESGTLTAANAAVHFQKLLQIAAGGVYNNGTQETLNTQRAELILDLIEERPHSLVAFNWRHQGDLLCKLATKRKIPHARIDGKTNQRAEIVARFQNGEYKVCFIQPQAAAHGLTFTKGTTTIWMSPARSLENFIQFNRRIYRAGQREKTETILITARGTIEQRVYNRLNDNLLRNTDLLEMLNETRRTHRQVA